ncbi:6080_t:CDS:2, partial [Entrophospora sp. SA101]
LALYLIGSGTSCDGIDALDDYHNIHEKRCPNHTTLSEAVHLATSITQWINNTRQLTFDRIDQLTIHCYDNAIAERKEECKMKGTFLIGVSEQQLHSMQGYLKALIQYLTACGHGIQPFDDHKIIIIDYNDSKTTNRTTTSSDVIKSSDEVLVSFQAKGLTDSFFRDCAKCRRSLGEFIGQNYKDDKITNMVENIIRTYGLEIMR